MTSWNATLLRKNDARESMYETAYLFFLDREVLENKVHCHLFPKLILEKKNTFNESTGR